MRCLFEIYLFMMVYVVVSTAPVQNDAESTITSSEFELTENGYFFEYSTSNGITRRETGEYVKNSDPNADNNLILRVTGTYSYLDDKGEYHVVNYESGEYGYSLKKPAITPAFAVIAESAKKEYGRHGISSAALASLSG